MDSGFRSHRRGASARLRKTFRYPSEDEADDGNALEVMDEQEQESLITSLTTQNSRRNSQFRSLLLLIPAIASIPYLLALFLPSPPSSQQRQSTSTALFPLLALSSLAATTFITVKLPPTKTGLGFIDSLATASASAGKDKEKGKGKGKGSRSGMMRVVPTLYGAGGILQQPSPLETWLPYLNVGLCVLVLLTGLVTGGGHQVGSSVGRVYLAALPGVIYAATVVAKVVMAGVDPEGELGGLRYGYKGGVDKEEEEEEEEEEDKEEEEEEEEKGLEGTSRQ
ncbi:hypothetical protein B0H65DRAFT_548829 [Neurospora tetraspora]|uniref:Uncharacterized protein n=1 Tax=Neurospora tetraspora TaxID=94610 RepID=A0AAE0MRJ8_9PEZI|nr:hypothetical protein B0H65DRAFT_548829 [Neurospora tetraspora]